MPDLSNPQTVSLYDELPLWSAMFGALLLKHVPMARNLQVLDIGCGTGFPSLELAQRLGPSCTVWGIDPWETALERARLKAQAWGVSNAQFKLEKAEAMSFSDGQFDLIVSNLGINNFSDPKAALAECSRVCKPSGKLVLTTNLRGHMAEFYAVFETTLRELGYTTAIETLKSHINHRATVEETRSLLSSCGFTVLRVVEDTTVMRFADGSSLFRHYFINLGFMDAWKNVVQPEKQNLVFTRLEAKLDEVARQHGDLALSIPMAYLEAKKTG